MDAVSTINQHLDIDRLLDHYQFEVSSSDSTIIRCPCLLHGGSNPTGFAINSENGLWFCHTGACGGGDVYTLIQRLQKCSFEESVEWLATFYGVCIDGLTIIEHKPSYMKDLNRFIKMIKKNHITALIPYSIEEDVKHVTKFRQFKQDTLDHFGLGYVEHVKLKKRTGEDYTLHHRLVFPIIFNGIQVGLSFRRVKSADVPKWSHQPPHINTGDILYNYDSCIGESVVVVTEGIADVWAYYELGITAVATFGAHLTDRQYKLLMYTGANLVLSYDGDEAGRLITTKVLKLFANKANVSVVHFNDGEDPESIEREELRERYKNKSKL